MKTPREAYGDCGGVAPVENITSGRRSNDNTRKISENGEDDTCKKEEECKKFHFGRQLMCRIE